MNDLPCNAIWYFDSDCHQGDASLSWCYGSNADWRLKNIMIMLRVFFQRWGIRQSLFYGSSGGGFTSLALACLMRSQAIAINPQLSCLDFWPGIVSKFLKARLKPDEQPVIERLDLAELIINENYCPPMKILQNIQCKHDMQTQLLPFLEKMQSVNLNELPLTVEFYSDPRGHNSMPDKEACLNDIRQALNL